MRLGDYETDRKQSRLKEWDTICVAAKPAEINKLNLIITKVCSNRPTLT